MSITFAVRGDSLIARYANQGKVPAIINSGGTSPGGFARVTTERPGINGVNSIDLRGTGFPSPGGGARGVIWEGNLNTPSGRPRSILIRFNFSSFALSSGLFAVMYDFNLAGNAIGANVTPAGEIRFDIYNEISNNYTITSSTAGMVVNTWYDLLVSWTGDTTTNGLKAWLNGTQIINATSTRELVNPFTDEDRRSINQIAIGISPIKGGTRFANHWIDEFVIWDEALTSPTVLLESGSGVLNGSARTSYVAVAEYSGLTWPLVGKVKDGETWNKFGVTETGTREDANPNKVIVGESFGEDGTELQGTYVEVTPDKVLDETFYGANGTEFEGTLVLGCDYPTEADVRDGVVYNFGANTGSFGRHIPQTNQYWAPLEVQTEIYAILNADSTLTALIGANKVFDFVPDKQPFPYITLNILPFIDRDNATNDGLQCEFQVSVWYAPGKSSTTSRGNKPVQLIQKRIDELLQKRSVCVNGWNTLQLRRTYIDIETESDNVTKHGIQRFILFLGSKD